MKLPEVILRAPTFATRSPDFIGTRTPTAPCSWPSALSVFARQASYEKGMALAYLSKGVAWVSKGKYPEALECHLQALRISRSFIWKRLTANNYNNIGIVYSAMKEYARALITSAARCP